jgi:hypothetical protein
MPWDTMCLTNDPFMVPGAVARPTQFMSARLGPEERKSFWAPSCQQIRDRYADYKAGWNGGPQLLS